MSEATMSPSTDRAEARTPTGKSRLPARLTLAVVALLCVGGGWYGYQRTHGTSGIPMAAVGDFLPDGGAPRLGFNGRPRPGLSADGVNVMPGNVVTVRAAGMAMHAAGRADGKWQLNFNRAGTGDRQAIDLVNQARRRILEPRKPQADLKVTDAQLATLAAAVPEAPPELAPDAFAHATDLLGQLTKLPPTDARAEPLKKQLQDLVATAAKTDASTIAKEYDARAAKIRATLSVEQVQLLLDQRPARAGTAATKPVSK